MSYDQDLWLDFERVLSAEQCLVLQWYCGGLSERRIHELSTFSREYIRKSVRSASELLKICLLCDQNVKFVPNISDGPQNCTSD